MDSEEIMERMVEREVLEYLTEHGYLEGPAHGIALQVIGQGRRSLKGNQVTVFEKQIVQEYFEMECERCHAPIPACEVVGALSEDDDLCSWCRKMNSNDD